jgi:hypothetical protein
LDYNSFPGDEERFISFLFNMLENSIAIRSNSEKLIAYSESGDWENYAKALGTMIKDLIYFKFDSSSALNV